MLRRHYYKTTSTMKKLIYLFSVISFIVTSCAPGFSGTYMNRWDINPQTKYAIQSGSVKVYNFELVNTSANNCTFNIYTNDGKLFKSIDKGEKALFSNLPFNGIVIENKSAVGGSLQLYTYINEKGLNVVPKVKAVVIKE